MQIGGTILPGFAAVDRAQAYDLPHDDGSLDDIVVSETLERLSHRESLGAIKKWVAKLAPGGSLEIQVPDLLWAAQKYIAGDPADIQTLLMGAQAGPGEINGALFDREALAEAMVNAGLERIGDAEAPQGFIRLIGFKPTSDLKRLEGVRAVLSAPRYGPVMFAQYSNQLGLMGVPMKIGQGAYWHEVLCNQIEEQAADGPEFIVTLDYDSVWSPQDVRELYRLIKAYPEADAICPVQQHRGRKHAIFGVLKDDGTPIGSMKTAEFDRNLTKITTGHFGLTIFRAEKIRSLPRPWMVPSPNKDGRWRDGNTHADIQFWFDWQKAGNSLYLANRIPIGHEVSLILYPSRDFAGPIYCSQEEYNETGVPAAARR